jgi:asparagine synthase (glutamine-hydrolysing)
MSETFAIVVGSRDSSFADLIAKARDASGLSVVLNHGNFAVLADSSEEIALIGNVGAVIGTMFTVDGSTRARKLSLDEGRRIQESNGTDLLERYWGAYVAVLFARQAEETLVIREPSGGHPCLYAPVNGGWVIASDPATLLSICGAKLEIDWHEIAHHLFAVGLRSERTSLAGVMELLPGFKLSIGAGSAIVSPIWSPWSFASRANQLVDPAEAAFRLHRSIVDTIAAWSDGRRHVLLGLSGGLDSSIVAAALAECGQPFSCLNLISSDPSGDEREYAKQVADFLGRQLFEEIRQVDVIDVDRTTAGDLPRPLARAFAQESDRLQIATAAMIGADIFFSGGGGDNVFCSLQSVAPIADRIRVGGLGPRAFKTARDIAFLTGCSLATALAGGVRRAWRGSSQYRWPTDKSFLSEDIVREVQVFAHPWLNPPARALPGQAAHVALLLHTQNHFEGLERSKVAPTISPLTSQPVVEMALTIPSWMWFHDGHNRWAARAAFINHLPQRVIYRRSKATPNSFVTDVFNANKTRIAELLMEGKLAEQGILDRDAVWAALNSNRPRSELEYPRLMSFVDVEAWANAALLGDMRSTTGRLRASAAARGASPISCIARP